VNIGEIILISIGLAMDAAAVSLVAAASGYAVNRRARFRLSFHFGLFQALMPVLGLFAGRSVVDHVASFDHWVAFGLLLFAGLRMIRSGIQPQEESLRKDPSRGATLILLSTATSIDALAVGLSLAMLNVSIWYPSLIIGVVTVILSLAGIGLGLRAGMMFGNRIEILGGSILIAIGLRILLSHMLA